MDLLKIIYCRYISTHAKGESAYFPDNIVFGIRKYLNCKSRFLQTFKNIRTSIEILICFLVVNWCLVSFSIILFEHFDFENVLTFLYSYVLFYSFYLLTSLVLKSLNGEYILDLARLNKGQARGYKFAFKIKQAISLFFFQ